jgi:sulfhydrogenase subunit beta (sulfur reductase)
MFIIDNKSLSTLIDILKEQGYKTIGPTIKENAIVYDEIESINDLPRGWADEQDDAYYRIKKRDDNALFGYNVGPYSWKKYLFPPRMKLLEFEKDGKKFEVKPGKDDDTKYAFIGVRACELNAIFIQDKVFKNGDYVDPNYKNLRERIFIVAVNCAQAGGTCFCVSMKTGPKAKEGYDIALTEMIKDGEHKFFIETGSDKGKAVLNKLPYRDAEDIERKEAEKIIKETEKSMGRKLDTKGIKELLQNNPEHPQWEDVAKRCLTCANCTMVCPTCFCSTIEDITDISGNHAERWRKWDSCFTLDYSKVAGGNFRPSPKARYRQWMTHKLASWIDQFGTSGCVGCGRCITWCPAHIDITKEAEAIRNNKQNPQKEILKGA